MIKLFDLISGTRLRKKNVYFQYSTEEQFTGEYWVDGRKIYIKYIDATVGTLRDKIHAIQNMNFIIDIYGRAYSNWGQYWTIPCMHAESGYAIYVYFGADQKTLTIQYGSYYSSGNRAWGWVRYTKN